MSRGAAPRHNMTTAMQSTTNAPATKTSLVLDLTPGDSSVYPVFLSVI